ncbi:MAG: dihydroorotase [Acidobacteria bacterium]|nr:dihydroorotase [Acidobacteriota bacterium]MBI3656015.1 dihydroorotase [Acidobacteriota bacterium]
MILIKNGTVVDPANQIHGKFDVLIDNGKIIRVGRALKAPRASVINAAQQIVAPGFIDMHVHLREPGREDVETVQSGTAAAAAGGFTAVMAMPNTQPVNDDATVTRFILDRARESGVVTVLPCGAITAGSQGEVLSEIGEMVKAGAVAISDDGRPVMNAQVMRRALEYSKIFDIPVVDHCEDQALAAAGVMNEGYHSTRLGLRGMSSAAEEVPVARDVILAKVTGARVHIAHVSTRGAIQSIREAKRNGISITAEATPHHFTLTDEAVSHYDTHTKMNPPLRSADDVAAVIEGLADGTIDCIASDHAPHTLEDKMLEYDQAPFGIIGLETAVSLALDRLVRSGCLSIVRLVELMSLAPARLLKLPSKGALSPGYDADITILDVRRTVKVDVRRFRSKGRNTPFNGWELRGAPVMTIVQGKVVWAAEAHDAGGLAGDGLPMVVDDSNMK